MAVFTKPSGRRIWNAPTSMARWLWLAVSILFYAAILVWYIYTLRTQQEPDPSVDPLRLFGIFAFVLVLITAAYSLRRRFVRGLPGKVQDWLWMHTWVGIITVLVAMFHENFAFVTHDFCANAGCLTDTYWAGGALYSLILLVISGIIGRILDIRQTGVIAREASTNGVGIVRALEERILALEYTIERLCAGKSAEFKQFCFTGLKMRGLYDRRSALLPTMQSDEREDFQRVAETLETRAKLVSSLRKQRRARQFMRIWRTVHMVLACIVLITVLYHGVMELLTNVLHLLPSA